jgi:hypothetical protein
MAQKLEYLNADGNTEQASGSDRRINVSSRTDARSFYVSRDTGQAYVLHISDPAAAAGDIVAFLRNTSTTLTMFIRKIEVSAAEQVKWKIAYGDSATPTGTQVTPVNLNSNSPHAADVVAYGNGAVGGIAAATEFATSYSLADTQHHEDFLDMLMLGQNDSLTVEYAVGTGGIADIDIYFYMDTLD